MKEENRYSASQISVAIRFDAWRHFARHQVGYDLRPEKGATSGFEGAVQFKRTPLLSIAQMSSNNRYSVRLEREIADRDTGSFIIYREDAAATQFTLRGVETIVRRGEWVVGNYELPHTTQSASGFRFEAARLPRDLILPHMPISSRGRYVKLERRPGAEALAIDFLHEIKRNWDRLDERAIASAADTLARLIGIACGARPEAHRDAVRDGRLARLRAHVERHLGDPSLSPESAAAAERISLRTLHASFEPTGESFAAYVRRRRLEKCHAALTTASVRSVADIAFGSGFASLATFNRAFRGAFGASPSDIRFGAEGHQGS